MMESLFTNSITLWLRWLFKLAALQIRYPNRKIRLGYLADIQNCSFTQYNKVHKYSRLRNVEMGDFSYVNRNSQVYSAEIGKFVCIGPEVLIGLGEHPSSVFVSSHPMFYSLQGDDFPKITEQQLFEEFPTTTIGHDVWIGARAILKTGISIGNGAIVAAGSIVTKDVEPYSIVGGVPAKHIRYRFESEQIEKLQQSAWWDKDLNWLKKHSSEMTSIDHFLRSQQ